MNHVVLIYVQESKMSKSCQLKYEFMQKDQMLDLILFVQLKLRIIMYVNNVKSDFVVFFRQDKDIIGIH